MSDMNWDKVAKEEFNSMPRIYRNDWSEFRNRIMGD